VNLRALCLPLSLLALGVLAGRFIWPRQRGIPPEEVARVNAAWSAAARETETGEAELTRRPAHPALAKTWDFLQRLERTPAAEFPALWAELEEKGKEDQGVYYPHSSEELLLAERWAELDPEAAFASLSKRGEMLVAAIFRTWSRMNVETALAAVAAIKDDSCRAAALAGIFHAASENPADLIAWGQRLSFLDTSELDSAAFDSVIPADALRRAFESDPDAVRELGAKLPPWFRARLDALAAARELATDLPAALARIDAAGLTKQNATAFVLDMLPLAEGHPDKLVAVAEHLTLTLGHGWLKYDGTQNLHALFTALAKSAPDKVHALLSKAAADNPIVAVGQADAAVDLFATDPRMALQLAPSGATWIIEILSGSLLPPGSAGPPQEALELVRTAPFSTLRDGLLHEALTSLIKSSPDAAAAWVDALPPGELQDTARVTLDQPDLSPAQADLERAAASAAHGGDNAASLDLVRQVTRQLLNNDPEGTTAQIMAWPASPARDAALERAGLDWSSASTPDALTWAESLDADAQPQALSGILQTWAQAEPGEASEYLAALPPGALRDAPAAGFARGLSHVDPASSLTWAATVQDAALRQSTLMEVAGRWLAKNADAARNALQSIPGLTDSERRRLLTAPPPP
jgi:hypothetical protein